MFVNALTACDKYSLRNRDNLTQPIQMQLSEKEETYLNFFVFLKATLNFKRFPKKKETLRADGYPKLRTPRNVLK